MTHDDTAWDGILGEEQSCRSFLTEIARLLSVWTAHGKGRVNSEVLAHWCRQTAAKTSTPPNPDLAIRAAILLGIITQHADGTLSIHVGGDLPADLPQVPFDRLSSVLGFEIFERMMESSRCASRLRDAMDFVSVTSDALSVEWSSVPVEAQRNAAWLWFQHLGLARHRGHILEVDHRLLSVVASLNVSERRIGEEELQRRLAERSLRARLAEEYVVRLERERLIALGRPEYAAGVIRVAADDVNAGYDILTFTAEGEPEYIEVKSSVGRRDFFVLTRNEHRVAHAHREAYWIAWVEHASRLPDRACPVHWFRDPVSILESQGGSWAIEDGDLVVTRLRDDTDIAEIRT
jgi:hypothetical protein